MRVMISQPTEGLAEEQIRDARRKVIVQLDAQGHEVWGEMSSLVAIPPGANEQLWRLGRRLQDMAEADAVYFMDGWEKDSACRMTHEAAENFGIMEMNSYMPQSLFSDMQLKKLTQSYTELDAFIMYENEIYLQGKFVYNYENLGLSVRAIEVFKNPLAEMSQKWLYQQHSKQQEIWPHQDCLENVDKRRFVNQASRLFIKLRNAVLEGKIKTQFPNQLGNIKYQLDDKGRYDIVNYQFYPIASLYAIACEAIF